MRSSIEMKQILIRADDLGMSKGVNYGIAHCVNEGIVRSVGVMTNMPDVEHGLMLLKRPDISLGLHCCISTGKPILGTSKVKSLVDENGNFHTSKTLKKRIEQIKYEEVYAEVEAQLKRFIQLTKRKPDYFEGHAVDCPIFFKAMKDVAKTYDCPYLDMKWEEPVLFKNTYLLSCFGSMDPHYDPFKFLEQCLKNQKEHGPVFMLVLHPGFIDAPLARCSSLLAPRIKEAEMASSKIAKDLLEKYHTRVCAYHELT